MVAHFFNGLNKKDRITWRGLSRVWEPHVIISLPLLFGRSPSQNMKASKWYMDPLITLEADKERGTFVRIKQPLALEQSQGKKDKRSQKTSDLFGVDLSSNPLHSTPPHSTLLYSTLLYSTPLHFNFNPVQKDHCRKPKKSTRVQTNK